MDQPGKFQFDPRTQELLERLTVPIAIYQYIDKRVVTIALSQGFCDEFGFEDPEVAYQAMDQDMYRAAHPDDKTRVADAAFRLAAFDAPYDVVYRTRTFHDPDYIIVRARGRSFYSEPGVRLLAIWYAHEEMSASEEKTPGEDLNLTLERILTEEKNNRGMYYDYMTGLPNMSYFYELAEAGRERMRKQNVDSVILFFDLTGLKHFNELYGFSEGDRLIRSVAAILAKHFSNENCARLAQDHFAAFAPEEGLEQKLDEVIAECAEANHGKTLPLRIGIYPDRLEKVEIGLACDRARVVTNAGRQQRTSYYSFFDMKMMMEEKQRQDIIDNLERAVGEGWIKVYYQPVVRSASGRVCGVEALSRWEDPVHGLLMPESFVPALEESMQIHKLDLFVVQQVLDTLRANEENGIRNVPVSINFSRADFAACDLVQEVCTMVDAAQVDRKLINIEITESMVGRDFDYMKEQIERFRAQGFRVWMDDFGSGYSSLDVLQSVKFDLIKYDIGFMKRLNNGEEGRIILTEMMRMSAALGIDTVCEGVETEEQVRFLQEIGCSKMQGHLFGKPIPREAILDMLQTGDIIESEDPDEADYYEYISRMNLFDFEVLASKDENTLRNTFNTIPIAILELNGDKAKYVRSNNAYYDFAGRFFPADDLRDELDFGSGSNAYGSTFFSVLNQCCDSEDDTFRLLFNEKMADGSVVHSFVRRIGVNPVTGSVAVAVAVLSVTDPETSTTYADIARSLAADFYNIYMIDLDTDDYVEYSSQVGGEELSIERHGKDFFEAARRRIMSRVYEPDRELLLKLFTRENILRDLDEQGVFTITYRLIDTGTPVYVNLKITRMRGGNRIIAGISIIDANMKQFEEERKLRRERISLGRIAALSPDYLVLYTVDPVTGHYTQYDRADGFERFGPSGKGEDFFRKVMRDAPDLVDPQDIERHLRILTKDNMMRELQKEGFLTHYFRLRQDGVSVPVCLRATLVEEDDGEKILLGVLKDEKKEYGRELETARKKEQGADMIHSHIAQALARGYTDLYYVNMETGELIEYHTDDYLGVLSEARRGTDFFEGCERDAKLYVHPDDQEAFVRAMNREFLTEALDKSKVFELVYRRIKEGRSFYVKMRVSRVEDDERFIVLAVSDIDEVMRQRRMEKRMLEERVIYARLHALTGNFICVYVVDPETGQYREFSSDSNYEEFFAQAKEGADFFGTVREAARMHVHPEDQERFLAVFTRENVNAQIERSGIFNLGCRLMMDGGTRHVQLKAAMVMEKEGSRLIVGLNDVDALVRQEEEYGKRLAQAQTLASIDALTGVRNRHAYLEAETRMDQRIEARRQTPFAIVMLDVNNLKMINDTFGHQTGDQCLRDISSLVRGIFKDSPVFRVGGDEFVVIARDADYACISQRLAEVDEYNRNAVQSGGVAVAFGMAKYEDDACVAAVFERADHNMYECKSNMKTAGNGASD